MNSVDLSRLGGLLLPAVLTAGRLELAHFAAGVTTERKADKSPVTIADREAEDVIVAALTRLSPKIPVIAEEAVSLGCVPQHKGTFFLVDALDGTHMFIRGKPEFSVNIALVHEGLPVFGLIYVPPTGALYLTRDDGKSYTTRIAADAGPAVLAALSYARLVSRVPDRANLVAFNSRAAGGAAGNFLNGLDVRDARPFGSSMKFGMIAAGEGDLYARFGDTSEWDTAAGHAILEAAGGCVTTLGGEALTYGHAERGYRNPHFVAWGRPELLGWAASVPPMSAGRAPR